MTNKFLIRSAIAIILLGTVITGCFLYKLSKDFEVFSGSSVDVTKTGAVGDFIAGVVGTLLSFAGFLLVYLTYRDQRLSNEKDKKEARIFTLIQIHVDNANSVIYQNPYQNGN